MHTKHSLSSCPQQNAAIINDLVDRKAHSSRRRMPPAAVCRHREGNNLRLAYADQVSERRVTRRKSNTTTTAPITETTSVVRLKPLVRLTPSRTDESQPPITAP